MLESKLRTQSMDFAVQIINLVRILKEIRFTAVNRNGCRQTGLRKHRWMPARRPLCRNRNPDIHRL